jgi:hypothetical protein
MAIRPKHHEGQYMAPIILRSGDGVELTERVWAPRAANKKPIFNVRYRTASGKAILAADN